jgi:hypothetical protein
MGALKIFATALLISTSQRAGITGMSHRHLALFELFK